MKNITNQKLSQYIHDQYKKTNQLADQYGIFRPLSIVFDKPSLQYPTQILFCYVKDSTMYYEFHSDRRESTIRYYDCNIDNIAFYALFVDLKEMARLFAQRHRFSDRSTVAVWDSMFVELYGTISRDFQNFAETYVMKDNARTWDPGYREQLVEWKHAALCSPDLLLPQYMYPDSNC